MGNAEGCLCGREPCGPGELPVLFWSPGASPPQTTLPRAPCCGFLALVRGGSIVGIPGHTAQGLPILLSTQYLPRGLAHSCPCTCDGFLLLPLLLLKSHQVVRVQISVSSSSTSSTRSLLIWPCGSSPRLRGPATVRAWVRSEARPGRSSPGSPLQSCPSRLRSDKFQMCFSSS